MTRKLIRYAIVKLDLESGNNVLADNYCYPRMEAHDELQRIAGKDFVNYALYGLAKVEVKIVTPNGCYRPLINLTRHSYRFL